MRTLLHHLTGVAPDHHAVFHAFAEGLARMMRRRRPTARVRAVEL